MVYLLYDLLLMVAALVLIPWYLLRGMRRGTTRLGIAERLGFYGAGRLEPLAGRRVIWIHAVSVGETRAALPLIRALRTAYPDGALLLTNVTETGHAVASQVKELDLCLYFPFDFSPVIRRALARIAPSLVIIVETEIWPNFVRLASRRGVPVVLVNGRISDRSFPRYRRARRLLQPVLEQFAAFCMQSRQDAERIRLMGAPAGRVEVSGNLKFDMEAATPDAALAAALRRQLRLPAGALVWVAGSTHAGEEEIIADVYREQVEAGRELVLVLVPRHPERCRGVGEMLAARGMRHTLRSEVEGSDRELAPGEVLLVNTVGEMLMLYALSDLVFVGGSLVDVGGHNILEASLVRRPVIFGPHMHNFREISLLVRESGGGLQVADGRELAAAVADLIKDGEGRRRMGERGHALLAANAGATERTLSVLRRLTGA
jgi:3-deoxy-D-manno-octulosonic-acid transferase